MSQVKPGAQDAIFSLNDIEELVGDGPTALPTGNRQSIKQTEWTYSLMVHMSESLGVNCTFCHNSREFGDWAQSPLQRTTAFHGIRMARDLNNAYLVPLTGSFPAERLGPTGDVAKVSCATCHQVYTPEPCILVVPLVESEVLTGELDVLDPGQLHCNCSEFGTVVRGSATRTAGVTATREQ